LFVVNPDGNSYDVHGATAIKQCASSFLIGTLPNALAGPNPIGALQVAASSRTDLDAKGSLLALAKRWIPIFRSAYGAVRSKS
jgi:hypothetical protein